MERTSWHDRGSPRIVRRAVYRPTSISVNVSMLVAMGLRGAIIIGVGGCVSHPTVLPTFVVAVAYDVAPQFVSADRDAAVRTMAADFAKIRELGFDTVALRNIEDADRVPLLRSASRVNLRVFVTDHGVADFVESGKAGGLSTIRETRSSVPPTSLQGQPSFAGFWAPHVGGAAAEERAQQLCADLESRGFSCAYVRSGAADLVSPKSESVGLAGQRASIVSNLSFVWNRVSMADLLFRAETKGTAQAFVTLEGESPSGTPTGIDRAALLGAVHEALAAGATGVLLDRFRDLRTGRDLASVATRRSAADLTAIRAALDRSRYWGARLAGLAPERVEFDRGGSTDLAVTHFSGRGVHFLMVGNRSRERAFRGELVLKLPSREPPLTRAVEVPSDKSSMLGQVLDLPTGVVNFAVDLRPGDAVLWELF